LETELKTKQKDMKRTIKTLMIAATMLVLTLPNIMAEMSAELTVADVEIMTEAIVEEDLNLEAWMIEAPAKEKSLELEDWMMVPFKVNRSETAIVLEDWMFRFS